MVTPPAFSLLPTGAYPATSASAFSRNTSAPDATGPYCRYGSRHPSPVVNPPRSDRSSCETSPDSIHSTASYESVHRSHWSGDSWFSSACDQSPRRPDRVHTHAVPGPHNIPFLDRRAPDLGESRGPQTFGVIA